MEQRFARSRRVEGRNAHPGIILQENYIVDAKLANFASAYDLGRNPKFQ